MPERVARIRWQCRRGMLELDAILQPFFEEHFLTLTRTQQDHFERLLTCSDQDLFSWFIGSDQPNDSDLQAIITFIQKTL